MGYFLLEGELLRDSNSESTRLFAERLECMVFHTGGAPKKPIADPVLASRIRVQQGLDSGAEKSLTEHGVRAFPVRALGHCAGFGDEQLMVLGIAHSVNRGTFSGDVDLKHIGKKQGRVKKLCAAAVGIKMAVCNRDGKSSLE